MTTVLIVDDQPLQRSASACCWSATPDTEVVGEAAHGAEAVRKAAELRPDVVLMDVRMPGMDGIEATRRIVAAGGRSRVLVLTTFDLDEYAHAALRAGASGFLLKDAHPEELLAGIRAVAAGDAVIAPALTRRLLDAFAHHLAARRRGAQDDARPRSPTASARSSSPSARAGPTARSPSGSCCPSPRSRRTSAGSWRRSAPATASRPSSSPTTSG